eukprot:6189548-Pleurochrysis_carterae.AAC.2
MLMSTGSAPRGALDGHDLGLIFSLRGRQNEGGEGGRVNERQNEAEREKERNREGRKRARRSRRKRDDVGPGEQKQMVHKYGIPPSKAITPSSQPAPAAAAAAAPLHRAWLLRAGPAQWRRRALSTDEKQGGSGRYWKALKGPWKGVEVCGRTAEASGRLWRGMGNS